jgi:hypothetical protein
MFVELNAVQTFSFSFIYVSVSSMFTWIPVFRRKHALLLQARYNNNFESFTVATITNKIPLFPYTWFIKREKKRTKPQTMVDKILHKKLQIE